MRLRGNIKGPTVYVAGHEYCHDGPVAKYWKNGTEVVLSEDSGIANSIFVFDQNVYVAGSVYKMGKDVATYWLNGVANELTDGMSDAHAVSIFVVP